MAKYSDVIFLEYSRVASKANVPVRNLRYILFDNVENQPTWAAVLTIFAHRKKATVIAAKGGKTSAEIDMPYWPGLEFAVPSEGAYALLATPLGASLAWLLIQHKTQFAGKKVLKACVHLTGLFKALTPFYALI